ncbi:cytochrome P450 71A1-like [Ananas comosus]|uniref:Cytochrome P450 71A1-like n=1 Tax=Ananas comosus TaxID=4615 RepID=A0A6P5EJ97_ANACO|nr:cytochrome P450 71A1-like [Ananas comosus]
MASSLVGLAIESPLLLLSLLLLLPLLLLLLRSKRSSNRTNLPPSPPKLPFIGNLHQFGSLPHRALHALSTKYGPLMLLRLGEIRTLVVSSPDTAREIMKTHDQIFANRPSLRSAEIILYDSMDLAFVRYGEHWRQMRKLCIIHLLSAKRVQSYNQVREEEVAIMIQKITQVSLKPSLVDLSEILYSFANDIVCRVVSGKFSREEGRNELFRKLIEENGYLLGGFFVEDYFPSLGWLDKFLKLSARAKRNFKRWDKLLEEVIKEHESREKVKKDDEEEDFVDVLLTLQKDPNMDVALKREHIKALLLDMFAAGTDTTYIVLEWLMAELAKSPNAKRRLQDEVRRTKATKGGMIGAQDLNTMSYLKAVVKEALRLHPPAPLLLPRESTQDCYVKNYFIPQKTRVIINAWAINRDPVLWNSPDEFRPERFLDSSSVDFKGNDFQFIPFGAGRRICPGMQFAVSTLELAVANLVYRFEWELPHGLREEEFDMIEAPGLTTRKREKLMLVAKPCCI